MGLLDVSQPYGHQRFLMGLALPFLLCKRVLVSVRIDMGNMRRKLISEANEEETEIIILRKKA
jgi:hypothetical protein